MAQQTRSLGKMSIAFLTNDEHEVQENGRRVEVDGDRGYTEAWPHFQVTATIPPHGFQPEDQSGRIGRWVATQTVTLPSDSDLGYAADIEESALCDPGRPSTARLSGKVDNTFPLQATTSAEQQNVDSDVILLADSNLLLPEDFRRSSKRPRSSRLVYTQEEKLFVMHARVLGNADWADISRTFEIIFGSKNTSDTISGLRSIYYRTRREWGMDYVTRTGPAEAHSDIRIVSAKLREHAAMLALDRDRRRTSRLRVAFAKLSPALQNGIR